MDTIRWGIVSTGRIARAFARDVAHVEGARLHAVASRTQERAADFAREHDVPRAYGSYHDLFDDPEVDVVYIATPHTLHAVNAADALRAGKAVLCEKPLTTSPEEARALIRVAEETGGYLVEGMWTYFLPAIRQAQAWVAEGRIGRLLHVKADFGYPLPYRPEAREYAADLAGGALLDMGVYPIAFAWRFLQQDPAAIHAIARRAPNGVEDDVTLLFEYPEATASLGCSFRCRLRNEAVVVGDEGYIAIPDFFRAHECSLYRLDERIDHFEERRDTIGFVYEAAAVGDDLREGRQQSEVVPWAASLTFQDHMARVHERIATG
jgi:predicted dehydrogenase